MCCVLWLCQSVCVDVRVHFLLWAGGVASALQRVGTLCGRRSIHPEMQPPRRYREDLKLCVRRPLRDASIIFPSFFLFTFCSCSLLPHPSPISMSLLPFNKLDTASFGKWKNISEYVLR